MLDMELLQQLLIIAVAVSVITCAFIQKTKSVFKNSKVISVYSFIVNLILGIVFCLSFTEVKIYESIWVGLFSYIGADTLYKSLEGKLKSYADVVNKKTISVPLDNVIKVEE